MYVFLCFRDLYLCVYTHLLGSGGSACSLVLSPTPLPELPVVNWSASPCWQPYLGTYTFMQREAAFLTWEQEGCLS